MLVASLSFLTRDINPCDLTFLSYYCLFCVGRQVPSKQYDDCHKNEIRWMEYNLYSIFVSITYARSMQWQHTRMSTSSNSKLIIVVLYTHTTAKHFLYFYPFMMNDCQFIPLLPLLLLHSLISFYSFVNGVCVCVRGVTSSINL